MSDDSGKPGLGRLRQRVRAIERGEAAERRPVLSTGAAALDDALPGGGLARAALHEVVPGRADWDDGPAAGFCLAILGHLLRRVSGPVLWIARRQDLYPPGLAAFGVHPDRLLLARAGDDATVLWAMEEGLRCSDLAAVVGEVRALDRVAARRLQLGAEAGGMTALSLLRPSVAPRGREVSSTAATRWRVGALPGAAGAVAALPGRPRWRLELLRVRGGHPADFEVEWDDATGDFAMAAPFRDGAAATAGGVAIS
ncbi:ImuA family protein [Ferruginivarius sediminum]|uniref:Damage-inducible protein n=1 Tax=Ferruginivarius sediminum TaxID=2661937 RepID=A0A369TH35_9PROT|nr:damage-inducible protein [Ferruginivarius sediminum]RDD63934.1 damage-inducible protein [Ferruginivarius sediminum]